VGEVVDEAAKLESVQRAVAAQIQELEKKLQKLKKEEFKLSKQVKEVIAETENSDPFGPEPSNIPEPKALEAPSIIQQAQLYDERRYAQLETFGDDSTPLSLKTTLKGFVVDSGDTDCMYGCVDIMPIFFGICSENRNISHFAPSRARTSSSDDDSITPRTATLTRPSGSDDQSATERMNNTTTGVPPFNQVSAPVANNARTNRNADRTYIDFTTGRSGHGGLTRMHGQKNANRTIHREVRMMSDHKGVANIGPLAETKSF
jgi:hypothetical protein